MTIFAPSVAALSFPPCIFRGSLRYPPVLLPLQLLQLVRAPSSVGLCSLSGLLPSSVFAVACILTAHLSFWRTPSSHLTALFHASITAHIRFAQPGLCSHWRYTHSFLAASLPQLSALHAPLLTMASPSNDDEGISRICPSKKLRPTFLHWPKQTRMLSLSLQSMTAVTKPVITPAARTGIAESIKRDRDNREL